MNVHGIGNAPFNQHNFVWAVRVDALVFIATVLGGLSNRSKALDLQL